MSVYSSILCCGLKSNLFNSLKLIKNVNNKVYLLKQLPNRKFCNMASKPLQKQSYIAINVPKDINQPHRSRFAIFFRRCSHKPPKDARLKKADLIRLFSLAKPERWKLLGKLNCLFKTG